MIAAFFQLSNMDIARDIPPEHQFVPTGDPAFQSGYPALVPPPVHLNADQVSVYPVLLEFNWTNRPGFVHFANHGRRVGTAPVIYISNSYNFDASTLGRSPNGNLPPDWNIAINRPDRVIPIQTAPAAHRHLGVMDVPAQAIPFQQHHLSYFFQSRRSHGHLQVFLASRHSWPYSQELFGQMEAVFRFGVAAYLGYDNVRPQYERLNHLPARTKTFEESSHKGYHLSYLLSHGKIRMRINYNDGTLNFAMGRDMFRIAYGSDYFWLNGELRRSESLTLLNHGTFYVGADIARLVANRIPDDSESGG